jgi:hypothetical protein
LANSLAGSDMSLSSFDMHITCNRNFSWYFGTDGNTPAGRYDFVSVALHEIGHGLNFAGSMSYAAGSGGWGYGTAYPNVYDTFMEDGVGNALTNTAAYTNPSPALGAALTSNSVWFDGAGAVTANGGQRVRIYAPTTWAGGSSYSHLDYAAFAGTANRLMVYAFSSGSSVHDPGPVTKGLLKDLGWTYASSAKSISAFNFDSLAPAVTGVISEGARTISLTVPFGTNVTALVPTIAITGVSVSPATGVANNFTVPATYIVTAEDASTQAYAVTVVLAPSPVKSVTVTAPNGGESWAVGSSHSITWTSSGAISNVKIEYSTNGGAAYAAILASTANSGSYAWTVPNAPAAACLVRVSDASTSSINDVSKGAFTIRTGASPALKNDFNGDGNEDVLWRNVATGEDYAWYMGFSGPGLTRVGGANILTVTDAAWQIVGTGDFNGDGKPDILWRNAATGENLVWYMNGVTRTASAYLLAVADRAWRIVGTGDFNGDGKPDILWRNAATGENLVWYMNGVTRTSGAYLLPVTDLAWQIVGTGDFNSDGKPDILWRNAAMGENFVWYMNGATRTSGAYLSSVTDLTWQIAGTGDFDSDGLPDILWRNSVTGENYVWYMNGAARTRGEYLQGVPDLNWKIVNR